MKNFNFKSLIALVALLTIGVGQMWADHTFTAGQSFYYDFTAYYEGNPSNKYVNIWNDNLTSYDNRSVQLNGTNNILTVTLAAGKEITIDANTNLFKCEKSGWQAVKSSDAPTEAQNTIIVAADGSCHWGPDSPSCPNSSYIENKPGAK